jgi:hypothetical protein
LAEVFGGGGGESAGGEFERGDAFVGDLEVGSGLDEAVIAAIEEVFAKGFEALPDLVQLLASLFFAAVRLDEAALEDFVFLLKFDDDLLEFRRIDLLGRARNGLEQQPEGGGKEACVTGGEHVDEAEAG